MSGETSNPKPENANTAPQFHGPVHIHVENVHLGAGDVTQGQKASTTEKSQQKMKEVEKKVSEVCHTQERLFHVWIYSTYVKNLETCC